MSLGREKSVIAKGFEKETVDNWGGVDGCYTTGCTLFLGNRASVRDEKSFLVFLDLL